MAGWSWLAVRAGKSAFWKDLDAIDGWREGCGRHGWRGGRDVTVRRRAEACADEAEEWWGRDLDLDLWMEVEGGRLVCLAWLGHGGVAWS